MRKINLLYGLIAVIFLLSACSENKMTKEEIALIQSGTESDAFRVLLTTNEEDSIVLRTKSENIGEIKGDKNLQLLIERLKMTMDEAGGVGIAAAQVGILRNVFLFVRIDKEDYPVQVAINPRIIAHPEEKICFENDGCLSIPEISGNSYRYPWVEVEYNDENGKLIRERLSGYLREDDFTGIIFQHEYDHLQGVLFIDKLCGEE